MPSRAFFFALLALITACGSGTLRPTDETGGVAPAPSPAPSPPVVDPDPAPPPSITPAAPGDPPSGADADTSSQRAAAEVEIRRIGRWVSSGIKGSRRLVIRDQNTWSHFWSELGAGVQPTVDFGRDLVIAVASGERSSGGHDIAVQRVSRSGGELRIEVLETSPGAGCMSTTAMTQPVDVVVAAGAGVSGWSFIDQSVTRDC
ncbi:MAG: protease complex subunit PrcB family protein [Gemmatimonadales bacterium]|nr:protease complex subunit PrcB family protein [Gemmatimonadales bacterium]